MTVVSAQISVYPLGQADLTLAIQAVLDVLEERGLALKVGTMSTVAWGEEQVIFEALQEAFSRATAHGGAVMNVTISNTCPLPDKPSGESDHG